jgi:hypothetical protein
MSFPYIIGLPNPPDDPSQDVAGMQNNTNTISSWVGVDHIGFNNAAGGKHLQVTYPNITSQVTPTDPVSILYTKNDAASHPQLFFLNSQNSTFYVAASNGSTVLMGGIILQWGSVAVNDGSSSTVMFPIVFPSACFNVQVTARTGGSTYASCRVPSTSQVIVTLPVGSGNQTVYWMAIGN